MPLFKIDFVFKSLCTLPITLELIHINFKLEKHFHHHNLDHFHQDLCFLNSAIFLVFFCCNIIAVIDIELKVNVSIHKLLTSFLTITKIFHSYSQFQFNIYGTWRSYFCYLKLIFSLSSHLLIFFPRYTWLFGHSCCCFNLQIAFVSNDSNSRACCLLGQLLCIYNISLYFKLVAFKIPFSSIYIINLVIFNWFM